MKKYILLLSLTTFPLFQLCAQNINTIAGTGIPCFGGDGGPATAAKLNSPTGVSVDNAGNVYVVDAYNVRIRKISASGIITTIAGTGVSGYTGDGGPATAAEFTLPYGVSLDASGNIYIADEAANVIRKINTSGIITTVAGNGTYGYSGDGGAATLAELGNPTGTWIDTKGNIYIADNSNSVIRKVNTAGIISTFAGNGAIGFGGDGGPASSASVEFNDNNSATMDGTGNIYIADMTNYRIRMINTSGTINTVAGTSSNGFSGDGGPATNAELDLPTDMKVDASGNIYIASFNSIRKVNTSGVISTIGGFGVSGYSGDGGPATAAEMDSIQEIALDPSGNIYIADAENNRIRKISNATEGIDKISYNMGLTLYPNPNNGIFQLRMRNYELGIAEHIEIYNTLGETVYTGKLNNATISINISSNASGVYLYKVLTETGDVVSEEKFIIQK